MGYFDSIKKSNEDDVLHTEHHSHRNDEPNTSKKIISNIAATNQLFTQAHITQNVHIVGFDGKNDCSHFSICHKVKCGIFMAVVFVFG